MAIRHMRNGQRVNATLGKAINVFFNIVGRKNITHGNVQGALEDIDDKVDELNSNLEKKSYLYSDDKKYLASMQGDGNFVIYDESSHTPKFDTISAKQKLDQVPQKQNKDWTKLVDGVIAGTTKTINLTGYSEVYVAVGYSSMIIPMTIPVATLTSGMQMFYGGMYNTASSFISVQVNLSLTKIQLSFMNVSGTTQPNAQICLFAR